MLEEIVGFAGFQLFSKLVNDLGDKLIDKTGKKIELIKTNYKTLQLYENSRRIRMVKTIWQFDKSVDLCDFYCDTNIIIEGEREVVRYIDDFNIKDNILIEGIAGQGKSIFLRYLCSNELEKGNYIPLFIELRKIDKDSMLHERIFATFESLGFNIDDYIFSKLASTGKILLLLDAFDEIPNDLKSLVLREIEDISSKYPSLKFVITTRPHQTIFHSPFIQTVKIDFLRNLEYIDVINKISESEEKKESLIHHIDSRAPHLKGLLTTPLMVTLLVILYKSYDILPNTLSGFYDALFPTMLSRHDGSKPGFIRDKRTHLDDSQYRRVFEMICIVTKETESISLSRERIHDIAEEVLEKCDLQVSPYLFIDDIVHITCLILHEGDEYRFIHKSVQEYYTASFIKRKPEPWISIFYQRIFNEYRRWDMELTFLKEIDYYRFVKYYIVPAIEKFLLMTTEQIMKGIKPNLTDIINRDLNTITIVQSIDNFYGTVNKHLSYEIETPSNYVSDSSIYHIIDIIGDYISMIKDESKIYVLSERKIEKYNEKDFFNEFGDEVEFFAEVSKLYKNISELKNLIDRYYEKYIDEKVTELLSYTSYIKKEEDTSLLKGLL